MLLDIWLPPSQMHLQAPRSARLVARKIRQPGSSYLKMNHDAAAPWELRNSKKISSHDASVEGNS